MPLTPPGRDHGRRARFRQGKPLAIVFKVDAGGEGGPKRPKLSPANLGGRADGKSERTGEQCTTSLVIIDVQRATGVGSRSVLDRVRAGSSVSIDRQGCELGEWRDPVAGACGKGRTGPRVALLAGISERPRNGRNADVRSTR
jgi:hypothetical protein